MSKTQDKRKERRIENLEFLIARRNTQVQMFEQALAIGEKLYNDNKEKLSDEEVTQLEGMKTNNFRLLEGVKTELLVLQAELDDLNKSSEA